MALRTEKKNLSQKKEVKKFKISQSVKSATKYKRVKQVKNIRIEFE